MSATGGIVTGGGQPDRTLSSDEAAAFTQSWTPIAIYGTPEFEVPPADTPIYTVSVDYVAVDAAGTEGSDTILVNFATDGVSSWIALPEQALFASFSVAADQANKWFRGNQVVIDAFNGKLQPQPVDQPSESTTTVQRTENASSDSSPVLLIAIIVVAAAVIIGAVIIGSRRRGKSA
jgi:hypothetical protein